MARIVTIRTVAERAGCSIATVSRVINRSAPTSAEVETRVRAAIEDLGYRPSEIGRALKTLRMRTLGVVIPSLTNPVFAASVAGMEAEARKAGHTLLLTATDYDPARERTLVETLVAQNVAGLLLTVSDPADNPTLDLLDTEAIPYVLIHNEPAGTGRAAVCVDNAAATCALTREMIGAGHRRIAYLAGRFSTSDRSRRRHEGYRAAMEAAGLAAEAPVELDYLGDAPGHAAAVARLFSGADRPTAALCSNDLLALSVVAALRDLGLSVPQDVSVAGFDGIALARVVSPSLATVETPTREMGARAVGMLFARIESGAAPRVERLPFTLSPGGTLAAAPPACSRPPKREAEAMQRRVLRSSARLLGACALAALTFATLPARPAAAADAICYNCPPEWADWGGMLKAIKADLGIDVPQDNKNSGQALTQIIAEKASPVADVTYLGVTFGIKAKDAGVTQPYEPKGFSEIPDGLKDKDGHWFTIHSGTLGLFVNKDALAGAPVPKCWADLLKPEYKGLVGYLDPTSAFVGYVGAVAVNQAMGGSLDDFKPGIEFFRKLQANQPIVPKQTSYARVLSGEIPILFDYDFNAYRARYSDMGHFEFVIPCEGTVAVPYVMSMVKGAPHPEAAKKVLDYVLSDKGQTMWAKAYLRPARDVKLPKDVADRFLPAADYARAKPVDYAKMEAAQKGFSEAYLNTVK